MKGMGQKKREGTERGEKGREDKKKEGNGMQGKNR